MFRDMKKDNMYMTDEENRSILVNSEYMIISTIGEDGFPYGFPMSYIYRDDHIYFHCALNGHKVDNMKFSDKVSFNIVSDTKLRPELQDTDFKSIIGFGKVKLVDGKEKSKALKEIIDKYAKLFKEEGYKDIGPEFEIVSVYKIEILHITGKERKDGKR